MNPLFLSYRSCPRYGSDGVQASSDPRCKCESNSQRGRFSRIGDLLVCPLTQRIVTPDISSQTVEYTITSMQIPRIHLLKPVFPCYPSENIMNKLRGEVPNYPVQWSGVPVQDRRRGLSVSTPKKLWSQPRRMGMLTPYLYTGEQRPWRFDARSWRSEVHKATRLGRKRMAKAPDGKTSALVYTWLNVWARSNALIPEPWKCNLSEKTGCPLCS